MTKIIISSIVAGILFGFYLAPPALVECSDTILMIGLSLLMLCIGFDIGRQGGFNKTKSGIHLRAFLIPIAVAIGTVVAGFVAGIILPYKIPEMLAVGVGFGWYSFAPVVLAEYSTELSAMSFMHNILRELLGMILIPIVSKHVGYFETLSLPGAGAMDVCLPIIEKTTDQHMVIYSFATGMFVSILVPTLLQIIVPFL